MSFAYPWILATFPLALIIVWLLGNSSRESLRVPSVLLWTGHGAGRARFLWIKGVLEWMTLAFLITALARPLGSDSEGIQVTEGIAIQLLVDVSSSMDMKLKMPDDKSRTRLEVAKEMVENFIKGDGDSLSGREGDMIGLITFARYADTRSPLTSGHEALIQLVQALRIQDRPNEDGTAYGDALALAAARLKQLDEIKDKSEASFVGPIASKVIILLTDGENNSGSHLPLEAAGLAKSWDCRVYSISMGDVPPQSGNDQSPPLSPSEKILDHISEETGGIFRRAYDYTSLKSVYEEIDQLEQTDIATINYNRVEELFWLPLLLALLCFTLHLLLDSTRLRTVP